MASYYICYFHDQSGLGVGSDAYFKGTNKVYKVDRYDVKEFDEDIFLEELIYCTSQPFWEHTDYILVYDEPVKEGQLQSELPTPLYMADLSGAAEWIEPAEEP